MERGKRLDSLPFVFSFCSLVYSFPLHRNRGGVKIIRPLPNEAGASLPPPYVVQKAIKQEQQAFQDYTARWQQSLRDLQQIDQVFII